MLRKLTLENYRNHPRFELELADITILLGHNGAGKSNILESLVVLSFCRSYREAKKSDLIMQGQDYARITGDDLEVFIGNVPQSTMRVKDRGVSTRTTDHVGKISVVILSPETLEVVTGAPNDRRRFLDIMLCQVDKEYMRALVDYTKVRRQRNHLLRRIHQGLAGTAELDYWDEQLIELGELLVTKRTTALKYLNQFVSPLYQTIANNEEAELIVHYQRKEEDLRKAITQSRGRDIADERTNHGPHADDLEFTLNNRSMDKYASRGEIKSALLAVKIAELQFLESERSKRLATDNIRLKPILLLDDIFSEFDPERRKHLSSLISKYQTVITSADQESIPVELLKKAKLIELSQL